MNELTATDKKGKKLEVEKIDENSWRIKNAKKLTKLSYWVDDTWDTSVTGPDIFWPAGTNIEQGKNYVLNTSGFFGYFEGQKEVPFQFNVVRAKEFYGSTGLIPQQTGMPATKLKVERIENPENKVVDVFKAADYDELIDSPLMYSKPDTAVIQVANTEVLIGSYSPTGKVTAKQIAESIREVLMAQKEYLGGNLPVEKYAFIFYFTQEPILSYGALEHSYSSFYYMPELPIEQMNQQLRDFAAHEFFHIVTPLTVHSEEIEDFDFNNPDMSKHLWMYEGVTEYFAGHVQVQYGLISPEQYVQMLREKILTAEQFKNDVPFTEISEFTLDKYHDQYYNVYQKGALIGLCLDINLRKLSDGKYGLRNLMIDLSEKYGKDQAFEDDELFDIITKMTYPEIGEFFNRYVKGTERLPLEEVFNEVGIVYAVQDTVEDFSLGLADDNVGIAEIEGEPKLQITSAESSNEMAKALGFRQGDILLSINDEEIPALGPDFGQFMQKHLYALPESDSVSFTVARKNGEGEVQEVRLAAPVEKVRIVQRHMITPDANATPEQIELRMSWLIAEDVLNEMKSEDAP